VNAITRSELDATVSADRQPLSDAARRGQLYYFFELALAHPGEEGIDWFRQEGTEEAFAEIWSGLAGEHLAKGMLAAQEFFSQLRGMSYENVEAAHIGLFSANFPHLPCPPYGSLFTAPDADKRLAEMLEIKAFYHRNGVDMSESYTDLPDHLCVELEFSQLLCFRENEAAERGDTEVVEGLRVTQAEFLDRFLLPLAKSLDDLAAAAMPDNPYSRLLEAMHCFVLQHRADLDGSSQVS
jgi:putative dimethyl sulfoxide reductase chaperone